MGKLFDGSSKKELEVGTITREGVPISVDSFSDEIEDSNSSMDIVTESIARTLTDVEFADKGVASLEKTELGSDKYFLGMESFDNYMSGIMANMGVKRTIPAMETFRQPYNLKVCNYIAFEGFFDYIKKLWEKIKDLFKLFFKKLKMFFRRLVGAELDLESYEKYLAKMIAEIKSKKLENNSGERVDTKLAPLVADEGMSSVDIDFLLSATARKSNNFANKINDIIDKDLADLTSGNNINIIKTVVDGIILNSNYLDSCEVGVLTEQIDTFNTELAGIIQSCYKFDSKSSELPDELYHRLGSKFSTCPPDSVKIWKMINDDSVQERLPKNFNSYFGIARDEDGKLTMFLDAYSQLDQTVNTSVKSISSRENLVTMYEQYKDLNKSINVKKFSDSVNKMEDRLTEIINKVTRELPKVLDNLKTAKNADGAIVVPDSAYKPDDPANLKTNGLKGLQFEYLVTEEGKNLTERLIKEYRAKYDDLLTGDNLTAIDNTENDVLHGITNSDKYIEASFISKKLIDDGKIVFTSQVGGSTAEDREKKIKILQNAQYVLSKFLSAIQNLFKTLGTNLVGTYTELRLAMAKYIYDSARLFK